MGWASGSGLMSKVIEAAVEAIPDEEERKAFYKPVIEAFRDEDCDTLGECVDMDPAFKRALGRRGY